MAPDEAGPPTGEAKAGVMIYIMNYGHIVSPGQNYLDCIIEGYRAFGFHTRYLSEAVRWTDGLCRKPGSLWTVITTGQEVIAHGPFSF